MTTEEAVTIRDRTARVKEEEKDSREETVTTEEAVTTRDRVAHSKEEEKGSREETAMTEEKTAISATKTDVISVTRTAAISVTRIPGMTEETVVVMTGENPARQFRHLQLLSRNRAVRNRRMLIRKKNTEMMIMTTKKECQKAKKERIIPRSRN